MIDFAEKHVEFILEFRPVLFPINGFDTLTHYTTKLPNIMDLDGTWEIGLAEIQYPHSWYNVKNKEAWLKVHFYSQNYKSIWSSDPLFSAICRVMSQRIVRKVIHGTVTRHSQVKHRLDRGVSQTTAQQGRPQGTVLRLYRKQDLQNHTTPT
jgi:hypothetical protein